MNKKLSYLLLSLISSVVAQNFSACTTPENKTGLCIPLRKCPSLFNQVLKGKNLTEADRQYLSSSQCGFSDNQPLVCCPDSTTVNNVLPRPGQCGHDPPTDRIIPGIKSDLDRYAWMALLEYTKPNNTKGFHCIGVLISNRYVLTAAHCLRGKKIPSTWDLTSVRLGEYDLLKDPDCIDYYGSVDCNPTPIDVPISEQIIHELYDSQSKQQTNNIALLKLRSNVEYTDFVYPLCLPFSQKLKNFNHDGALLEVVGWNTNTSEYSEKLQGNLNTVTMAECNKWYNGIGVSVADTQICGKSQPGLNYNSCNGLPGSPIMWINTEDRYWYLAGIEAFGSTICGPEGWPNVYTRISSYVDWIESKVFV